MSDEKKFTAKEVAKLVLQKAGELLQKSEVLKKYASENSKKIGYKLSEEGKSEKPQERDWDAFEVKAGKAKVSDPRLASQKAPQDNDMEIKEEDLSGRLDSQVGRELSESSKPTKKDYKKELDSRFVAKSEMKKKYEGFKAVEESAKESGAKDPGAVAAAAGRKKYGKAAFQHAAAAGKKMGKAEEAPRHEEKNPDAKEDATLGEKVEALVAQHMKENAPAEHQEEEMHEGHASPEMKEEAAKPEHRGHVKLAKFMGRMEHKRSLKAAPEMDKAETGHEKGVHTSAGLKTPGMSSAHLSGKIAMSNKHTDAHNTEKNAHKQVLGELKAQPKPNLPKSEKV